MAKSKFWLKGNRFDLRIPAKIASKIETGKTLLPNAGELQEWIKRLNKVLRYNRLFFQDIQSILLLRNFFINEYKQIDARYRF